MGDIKTGITYLYTSQGGNDPKAQVPALVCGSKTKIEPVYDLDTKEQIFELKETESFDRVKGEKVKITTRVPKVDAKVTYICMVSNPDWSTSMRIAGIKAEELSSVV